MTGHESFLINNDKSNCMGCQLCSKICPKNAISMQCDNEGFSYPIVDREKCINCGVCEKSCPIVNGDKVDCKEKKLSYVFFRNLSDCRMQSASGGAFAAIAESILNNVQDSVVYGAAWDVDDNNMPVVIHKRIASIDEVAQLYKSKYIQSSVENTYNSCFKDIQDGLFVIYSGTPCQIAGLKAFLKKDYDNLLTIDLLCHGIASAKIFHMYLKQYGEIESVQFRYKTKDILGCVYSKNICITKNGKKVVKIADEDSFMRGYQKGLFYRPSCYSCRFASTERVADITLGDYWNIQKIYPKLNDISGVSSILVNTQKGNQIVQEYLINNSDFIEQTDVDFLINSNERFRRPCKYHAMRDVFYNEVNCDDFDGVINTCLGKINPLKIFIKKRVPYKLMKILKKK